MSAVHPILADRIATLNEPDTLAMARIAREMRDKGHNIISLSLGEPDFDTPQPIKDAAIAALNAGQTKYCPVAGIADLRQAIADKLRTENNLHYSPQQIVVSVGAKQVLANIFMSTINPGDEAVIIAPYWVTYREMVKLCGGIPVFVNGTIENDFKATAAQIKAALTPKTRAVIYSSPSNPTGAVFTRDELREIALVVSEHNKAHDNRVLVVADEIYEYINFADEGAKAHASIAEFEKELLPERVAVVNGFSKGFAMTGWRIGYGATPVWLARACELIQGQYTSSCTSFAMFGALAALKGDRVATEQMRVTYKRRRDLVLSLLAEIPGVKLYTPMGAFYLFPDISSFFGKTTADGTTTIKNSSDMTMYLLNSAHVCTVAGSAFGADDCVRLSFAASDEELKEALRRVKEALLALN